MADDSLLSLKMPPHSVEAEQSVLGGLLLENDALDKVADILGAEDFYRHDHRLIYEHISRLIEHSKPADIVTVAESLESTAQLAGVGGIAYLGALAQNTPSAANIRRYAEIVRERAVMRKLVEVGSGIADSAFSPQGKDVAQLLDEAEARIFEIAEGGQRSAQGFVDIKTILPQVADRIDQLFQRDNPTDVTGISTGFTDLDSMTSGLQAGDLIIVAGRPSMGKAQPLDSRIKTRHGWKLMGELEIGDTLASLDGMPSVVTGLYPQGERQVYRITFSDGRSAECCAEHLWRVYYREWDKPHVVQTSRLMQMLQAQRYRGRLWIDLPNGDFGSQEELPTDPWVLGALLGDGMLSGTSLRFSTAADEMLLRMRQRVGNQLALEHAGGYDWRIIRSKERPPEVKRLTSNPLMSALMGLGLWNIASHEKFIPDCYLQATRNERLDLLRGLLDTDGWIERWGSIRFSSSSERLSSGVAELARSLGCWCSIKQKKTSFTRNGQRQDGRIAYVCNISHADPSSLFLLSDKLARAPLERKRQKRLTITSIKASRVASTQCISVSHPSQLYISDDYVVTHNTAFSLNIAENVALDTGLPVAVFSMEMAATQLAMRMIGSVGRLDQHKMRTGRLEDEDWVRLTTALGKLNDAPIFIDESAGLNALEVRARARRLHRQCGKLGLIVLDYLQLMSATRSGENRATEISEISRSLKALAKELDVPVVALSQLNRGLEQRPNKRPVMSDLRESGAIEQDADVILFIYRDEVYNPDSQDKGTAEIIIGKQRNGPIGTVRLTFIGEHTRFENFASTGGYHGGSEY